jgi:hypothetical protein
MSDGVNRSPSVSPELLTLAFYSSLTLLSLEIEGRSYGGGILKVEPRELKRVLVPWSTLGGSELAGLAESVDGKQTVNQLRAARLRLRDRRLERGRKRS